MPTYAAVDLGATSGRVALGAVDDGLIKFEEIHRFVHEPEATSRDGLVWRWEFILDQVLIGLKVGAANAKLESIGVDSWAIDYGFLGQRGEILGPVHAYRDRRSDGVMERLVTEIGRLRIYEQTGIQFLPFNTIYQLASALGTDEYENASQFLMLPDLINHELCGATSNELTNASTTQLLNASTRNWDRELIDSAGLRLSMFPVLHEPGTRLGPISGHSTLNGIEVVGVASHDTASAVVGTPFDGKRRAAYISSGTWSLVGVEIEAPVTTRAAMEANVTNELGINGTVRLLKNVTGLWLLEECRRTWREEHVLFSVAELIESAARVPIGISVIDPNDLRFLTPGNMPSRIRSFCKETGQIQPSTPATIARCIFDSLALAYRRTLRVIESIAEFEVEVIHIIGGGSANYLLNQLTADACGVPVVAGPIEATVMGNLVMQALIDGSIGSLQEGRDAISRSVQTKRYTPIFGTDWGALERRLVADNS